MLGFTDRQTVEVYEERLTPTDCLGTFQLRESSTERRKSSSSVWKWPRMPQVVSVSNARDMFMETVLASCLRLKVYKHCWEESITVSAVEWLQINPNRLCVIRLFAKRGKKKKNSTTDRFMILLLIGSYLTGLYSAFTSFLWISVIADWGRWGDQQRTSGIVQKEKQVQQNNIAFTEQNCLYCLFFLCFSNIIFIIVCNIYVSVIILQDLQHEIDFLIKPESKQATLHTSHWPMLLKVDNLM